MANTVTQIMAELADREAIRECHLRYARAIDRADRVLLADVFWRDGSVCFEGLFDGTVPDYVEQLAPGAAQQMEQTAHLMGNNTHIEIQGNRAVSESYILAFHRLPGDSKPFDLFLGGRYLDTLEKREDVWRILHRRFVSDWFRECEDSADWQKGFFGLQMTPGKRYPDDISYSHLTKK
jgi:SnoaL-like domain